MHFFLCFLEAKSLLPRKGIFCDSNNFVQKLEKNSWRNSNTPWGWAHCEGKYLEFFCRILGWIVFFLVIFLSGNVKFLSAFRNFLKKNYWLDWHKSFYQTCPTHMPQWKCILGILWLVGFGSGVPDSVEIDDFC